MLPICFCMQQLASPALRKRLRYSNKAVICSHILNGTEIGIEVSPSAPRKQGMRSLTQVKTKEIINKSLIQCTYLLLQNVCIIQYGSTV